MLNFKGAKLATFVILCTTFFSLKIGHAAVITFTDKSTFLSGLNDPTLESFESLPTNVPNVNPIFASDLAMSISATGTGGLDWFVSDDNRPIVAGTFATDGAKFIEAGTRRGDTAPYSITFSFFSPIRAFGLHIVDFGDVLAPGELTIATNQGDTAVIAATPPQLTNGNILFFGLVSTSGPFSSITLSNSAVVDGIGIDELYYAATVSEPIPLAIFCVGLIALRWLRRQQIYYVNHK